MVRAEVEGFSSGRVDDVESARTAEQHSVNLGHRSVAVLAGSSNEPMHFTVPLQLRLVHRPQAPTNKRSPGHPGLVSAAAGEILGDHG